MFLRQTEQRATPFGLLRARPASPQPYATGHDGLPTLSDAYLHERVLKTPAWPGTSRRSYSRSKSGSEYTPAGPTGRRSTRAGPDSGTRRTLERSGTGHRAPPSDGLVQRRSLRCMPFIPVALSSAKPLGACPADHGEQVPRVSRRAQRLSVKVKSPESLPLSRTADTSFPSVISRSTSARERPQPSAISRTGRTGIRAAKRTETSITSRSR